MQKIDDFLVDFIKIYLLIHTLFPKPSLLEFTFQRNKQVVVFVLFIFSHFLKFIRFSLIRIKATIIISA